MRILLTAAILLASVTAAAARPPATAAALPATSPSGPRGVVTTTHEVELADGAVLAYRARAGTMPLTNDEGKTTANIFYVAYEELDAEPGRPVTFVFNGGPGAASVWLHLGVAGPFKLDLEPDGTAPAPPYRAVPNPHTWLEATDLVFIDPVGTGFSRPEPGQDAKQFYGVQEDIASVAEFIRLYTTRYQRWASPKFLAGESYGTTRAAGLSEHLLERHGIALNGIVMVSTVLSFQTISPSDSNDLPYPLFLPTYAAVAWYHKQLPQELQQKDLEALLREVQAFALADYTVALAAGQGLDGPRRKAVIDRLAAYTGLPPELIDRADLRVSPGLFQKNLLQGQRQVVGRFDGRVTGYVLEPVDNRPEYDPSLSQYLPIYAAAFNDYVRRDLGYESDLPYEILSGRVHPWNWGQRGGFDGYLDVAGRLRAAMAKNPHLKVMVSSGYYDLATPYLATDYTISRLNLSPELRENLMTTYYPGGHMMYHDQGILRELSVDVGAFLRSSTPSPSTRPAAGAASRR